MSDLLTVEQFKSALPTKLKRAVSDELISKVNKTLGDPEMREIYRDNLLSYTSVISQGKFSLDQYLNAVKYVSHKIKGDSNILAYSKTFPEKIQRFNAEGVESKDVASYVTAYNKSKLVNLIYEQTLVPTYVLNADLHQKALNVQADLMMSARSEKVRMDAANSLLTHLKMPDTAKVQLDVNVKEDSTIEALRASTMQLVAQQKQMLEAGAMEAQDVAHSKLIIEGEYEAV